MASFYGGRRVRSYAVGTLTIGSIAALAMVAIPSGLASAAPTPYTWNGTDGTGNFSDGGNWVSGTAPQPKTSDDLTFPELSCENGCGQATNDVTGLKVPSFALNLGVETDGENDYGVGGNAIKIGAVNVTSDVPNGSSSQGASFLMPWTLLGSESWSVDIENGSNVSFGTIQGASSDSLDVALPVSTPGNSGGFLGFPSINTGPLTFQGSPGAVTYITNNGGYNATSGQPVKFDDTGLFVTGPFGATTKAEATVHYGPLTIKGSTVFFGNSGSGPWGINDVSGNASLDSATSLNFNALDPGTGAKPVPGLSYPQLNATGTIKLGSANLGLYAGCSQALGLKYTIVTGGTVKGTFNGLPNDTDIQANGDNSSSCSGGSQTWFEIKYSSTAVTLTVVPAPGAPAAVPATAHVAAVPHELPNGKFTLAG